MSVFKPAPYIRPRPCIGALMDIPSGRYHRGKHGDMILNGGFSNFIGIGGRGNTFKTTLSLSTIMIVLNRYAEASTVIYDTEITFPWDRLELMARRYPGIHYPEDVDSGRIVLTSAGEYLGNEWWVEVRKEANERDKDRKALQKATPFLDLDKKPIKVIPIRIHFLDSMSQLTTEVIDELYEKNEIDDSAVNTADLRSGNIKHRLCQQIPTITTKSGMTLLATAHVGDEFKLETRSPSKSKLTFLKGGLQFKNTPEKFTFLSSNTWVALKAVPMLNDTTKAAEYPLEGMNDKSGDTDLMEVTLVNVRSKYGPTGHTLTLLISQSEGLLPSLTEFHYLKSDKDKFGLEGHNRDWRLSLYPDVSLSRTKVRTLIDKDARLRRALEITSELYQIYEYWLEFPKDKRVSPRDLYSKLKDYGYNWDILLDTRGYWTYDHYDHPVPPLSTMDLINMYHQTYIPYWYPEKGSLKVRLKEYTDVPASSA